MAYTYSEYCKRMRAQGKRPISEEEFNLKKDELREMAQDAKDLSERAKESAESLDGGFLKGLHSFVSALSKTISDCANKYGK